VKRIKGTNNQGIRGGVFEKKHRDKMGTAIWLFGWLCSRQTKANGLVHGGTLFTYEMIAADMDETPRRVERWLWKLREEGYISVKHGLYKKLVIRILNQKKFPSRQRKFSENPDFHKHQQTADMNKIKSTPRGRNYIHPQGAELTTRNGGFNGEKRIEERTATKSLSVSAFEALGITLSLWTSFKGMRERIHRPIVPGAEDLIVKELIDLQANGEDPVQVIEQAIKTASFMLYPVRKEGAKNGHESFAEKRNRTNREGIAAGFRANLDGLDRANGRALPTGRLENKRGSLPGIIERSKFGGNRRGLSAGDADLGVHAHGCDDPECDSRSPVDRADTIDVAPVSGSESGGSGDHPGDSGEDGRVESETRDR